jgi:hypothetical protein
MEDAETILNELYIYIYIDMYVIRLIIDRLKKHPYPGTKDSVGANDKGRVTLQQQLSIHC